MFEAIFDLSLKYKIPSNQIRRNRKVFYGLKKKRDELINLWFNRVQSHINGCEFGKLTEILFIDKFFCELSNDEINSFQATETWSLKQLKEYSVSQNVNTEYTNSQIANDKNVDQRQKLLLEAVKNEVVVSTILFKFKFHS